MKSVLRNRRLLLPFVWVMISMPRIAFPAATEGPAPLPPGHSRYIVMLNPKVLFERPDASAAPTGADIVRLGGTVEHSAMDRLFITVPEARAAELRKFRAVKYLQKALVGAQTPIPVPVDPTIAASSQPAGQSTSLRPATQSTPPTWSSGTYSYDGS